MLYALHSFLKSPLHSVMILFDGLAVLPAMEDSPVPIEQRAVRDHRRSGYFGKEEISFSRRGSSKSCGYHTDRDV
jgi:hypothetical protein